MKGDARKIFIWAVVFICFFAIIGLGVATTKDNRVCEEWVVLEKTKMVDPVLLSLGGIYSQLAFIPRKVKEKRCLKWSKVDQ